MVESNIDIQPDETHSSKELCHLIDLTTKHRRFVISLITSFMSFNSNILFFPRKYFIEFFSYHKIWGNMLRERFYRLMGE